MWSNEGSTSIGMLPGRRTFGPLSLIILPPIFVVIMVHIATKGNGSFIDLIPFFVEHGLVGGFQLMLPTWAGVLAQWKLVAVWSVFTTILMVGLPGKKITGPVAPSGHVPIYKENGVPAFFLSCGSYIAAAQLGLFPGGIVYANIMEVLCFMSVFAFFFCIFLYFKGRLFPSSSDNSVSGNPLFDFYWGVELYPRVFGIDIKQWTNCRFGMMGWAVMLIDYVYAQYALYGYVADSMLVSVGIQLIYIFKFFWWEHGYFRSIDIMHDHAGWYICWGCLAWVPSLYTGTGIFLVNHPVELGLPLASFMFIAGVLCIWINYDADNQRAIFRATKGKALVWGKKPEMIVASYVTEKGEKKESLLLCSGWWSISRHFHYLPELGAAFFWCIPGLNLEQGLFYCFPFLTILLADRGFRDDARCAAKYGKHWDKYKQRVPYKFIPYVL